MLLRRVCFIIIVHAFGVSCAGNRSLTFVIDDTLSMQDDIDQVLRASKRIFDVVTHRKGSEIKDVVLVTFNDPEVVLRNRTSYKITFLRALRKVITHNLNNFDCPEYALSGIIKALNESRQESYIYVFTDASAKDHSRLNEVKSLCEKKQSQVVIVLTGNCDGYVGEKLGSMSVYYEIARVSNGLVFVVPKEDVEDIVNTIPDTISDQRSVITYKVVRASHQLIPVIFTMDDKTEYVTIHASGKDVELEITDFHENPIRSQKILWKTTAKMVKLYPPRTGRYITWVKGNTDVTVVVYAATDFAFDHGFSEFVPKSLTDASKQPIADQLHYLSISVTDPEHTVYIKSAEILDMDERVIGRLPLKKASGDFYITDKFKSPSHMFKIQVTGIEKKTGKEIKRSSKTAIEPQIPPPPDSKVPVVTITDGSSVEVDYGGEVVLTCKVSGYPAPRIRWTSDGGTILSEKSNIVELPYDYISYLKLSNVRHSGAYYCTARNREASQFSKVTVYPKQPIWVQTPRSETIQALFGKEKQVRCGIASKFPLDIQWKTPLKPSEYTLSADKMVLTIKSVDLSAQGRYACEASLKFDRKQKLVTYTNIVISDLAPPTLVPSVDTITVTHGSKVHIKCKISGGAPRPTVSWKVLKTNEAVYRDLSVSGEELIVASASLADAGTYHCTAHNPAGYAVGTTKLIVQMKPAVVIEEGSKESVAFGSEIQMMCKIVAYPLPKIGWRNSKGTILASRDVIMENEIRSRLNLANVQASDTYTCFAENILGISESSIDIKVKSPFVVGTGGVISSKFGSKTDIICDVRSRFPLRIKWSISSGNSKALKSDKYKISEDGTTLTILYTDVEAVGTYSCEASLANNDKHRVAYTTTVEIDNLTPPVLQKTGDLVTMKNKQVKIPCKIVGGVPPPTVKWQVMKKGENTFTKLSASGHELVINSAALSDAGIYRCKATNVEGIATTKTELIVQTQPEVVIDERSSKTVSYGSNLQITCKIVAFPLPKIVWKNSKGDLLTSEDTTTNNKITSRLNLPNIRHSDTYTCFAENILGTSESGIDIEVTTPLVVGSKSGGVISSEFGSKTDIICDVKSRFPLKIRWLFKNSSGKSEALKAEKYKISADGTTLTILYTDVEAVGTYSCEAYLTNDDNRKIDFSTRVQIDDLTPPVLRNTEVSITVKKKQKVKFVCPIIEGVPPPVVSWHVMKKGATTFTKLSASGQELVIDSAALSDAGIYRCEATNVQGKADQITELIVQTQPEVVIEEGTSKAVSYGSNAQITCKIVAFPLPKIVWKNSKGDFLTSEDTTTNNEITSRLNLPNIRDFDTYTCLAENILGTSESSIDMEVTTPFVVGTQSGGVISSDFGSKTDIICDVKSKFPLKIKWLFKNSSGKSEALKSDKYNISAAGTTLTILYTDVEAVGTYSCEASLTDDDKRKIDFTTRVQLNNLTPPVLRNTEESITVKRKQKVQIFCPIIEGVPPPVVSWHVMKKGATTFTKLSASGQELVIDSVALSDAGMYRCEATNVKGKAEAVTELIVQTQPEVVIEEGSNKTVTYGSNVQITCKIVAFPLPKIIWKNSKGNLLTSEDTTINNEITSRLNLPNIKDSDTYTCFAENILGTSESSIDMEVTTPFVIGTQSGGVISSEFGSRTDIICDVKSKFPLKIKWLFKNSSGKPEALKSDKYKISAAGTTLTILYTDVEAVGSYSCEASLTDDDKRKIDFSTRVQIDDLTPPVLRNTEESITVKSKQKVKIICPIVSGVPPPVVSWQVIKQGATTFTKLSASGQELVINSAALSDAGMYRCEATNVKGKAEAVTELIVQTQPEVVIEEGSSKAVSYGSNVQITCKIVAFPLPKVVWKNSKEDLLTSDVIQDTTTNNEIISRLNLPNIRDSDTYTCFAQNILGTSESSIDMEVTTPFVLGTQSEGVISSEFGSKTDIICDVKSKFPLKIRWFFNNSSGKSEALKADKYKISADRTTLTILSTDMEAVGTYSCEASLTDDDKRKIDFTTRVQIDNLTPPVLRNTEESITVKSKQKVQILCPIIEGVPPPVVSWHVMKKGATTFTKLSASGQELVIDSVALSDAGMYRCEATNVKGKAEAITELIVQTQPEVVIEEGSNKTVTYGSNVQITCKVVAFPLPKIIWKNSKGNLLTSEDTTINNEITSRLNLPNIKDSDTYTCFAENILGTSESSIDMEVTTPFVIGTQSGGVISSEFGSKTDIICDVKSKFPLKIKWLFKNSSGKPEALKSDKYKISAAGTTLTILYTDVEAVGSYSCEAFLTDDDKRKIDFSTRVQIDDLTPPVLRNTEESITVKSKQKVKILCPIVSGVPPPVVSWHVMTKGATTFTKLSASGQELVIDSAALSDAGMYRCEATNVKGKAEAVTELIVQTQPEVVIEEGSSKAVSYGSNVQITCKIVAFPLPKVVWKNSKEDLLTSDVIQDTTTNNEITSRLNLPNIKDSDTYTCFAQNSLGTSESSIDIEVTTPFVVGTQSGGVISSEFGSKTDIICDVKSKFPLKIRWFFNNSSGKSEALKSDKYKISAAGTTLTILYTDVEAVGTYSCEASLTDDDKRTIDFSTRVQIDDLTPPVLRNTEVSITVKSTQKVKILCPIIEGVPPPVVSWHVMKKGATTFTKLSASGQELVIDSAALSDAGMYQCEATNVKGTADQITELVVVKAAEASILEGTTVTVPYGSTNDYTCKVVGFPLPKVTWKDSKGNVQYAKNDIDVINSEVMSRLKVKNIKSSDTYTCLAANDLGQDTISVHVSVLQSINFPTQPETISVKYEDPTTIHCGAKSSMPINMKWYYQKDEHSPRSEILTSDKYIISSDKRDLLIVSTILNLVGKYTCEASLVDDESEKKSFTTNVEINNLKVPEITYSNKTIAIEKGNFMSAMCIADGIPKPVVTWQFKSIASDVFIALPDKGEQIFDPQIGYEKAGLYKCIATNDLGVQYQTIDVVVYGVPKITNNDTVYYGVTGDKVLKIPCEVDGFPEPTITWKKEGKVATSDSKLSVSKNAIYIKNPTEKDSTNFTCEAKNTNGYDTKTFEADISDFITYNEEFNSNIYLKVGESTDLKCILPHSDPKSIRWYVNGESTKFSGTFYSIKNAQYSNDGNYTCRLNTDEGSESSNYVVDVGYKPRFKADAPATIDWQGNKEDTLDCDVHAKPSAKVEWFYNGKPLDVTWPELAITGWGQYSCKASNVHDSVQRTFIVTSNGCLINRTAVNVDHIPLLVDDEQSTWPTLATTNEFYTISATETITLECATLDQPGNTFKAIPKLDRINAKCHSEDKFTIDGNIYKFSDLQCKSHVKPSQVHTKKTCMKNGEVVEVGFKLVKGFLKVYETCYSEVDHRALYTKVVMSAVNSGNIVTPAFKRLETKGGRQGSEPRKCAYDARRLVNPVDVAFGPAQTATLSDQYNTATVYEPCEDSSRWSWSGVEQTIEFALYSYDTLTVWTGASQHDSSGIPRYLWKVVLFDDDTFETIVYVNAANPSSSDILCPENIPDVLTDVTNAGDQFTYACSMNDFLKAFNVPLTQFT